MLSIMNTPKMCTTKTMKVSHILKTLTSTKKRTFTGTHSKTGTLRMRQSMCILARILQVLTIRKLPLLTYPTLTETKKRRLSSLREDMAEAVLSLPASGSSPLKFQSFRTSSTKAHEVLAATPTDKYVLLRN